MANYWEEYKKYGQAAQKAAGSGVAPTYNVPSSMPAYSAAYNPPTAITPYYPTSQLATSNPIPGGWSSSGSIPSSFWNSSPSASQPSPTTYTDENGIVYYQDYLGDWHIAGQASDTAMTPYQQAQVDLANRQFAYEQTQSQPDYSLQIAQMNQQQNQAELAWQQQQWNQQLAQEQKNYLANLAAEPRSWLEYAAAAGQPPGIQPWMMPLMPQDYGITTTGEAIPGWTATSGQGMPTLTSPSAQYQARMGPTAEQQYLGYEQARTGSRPEETQFRLWSMAPPGRSNMSLVQGR
jgi:hypothetical protein